MGPWPLWDITFVVLHNASLTSELLHYLITVVLESLVGSKFLFRCMTDHLMSNAEDIVMPSRKNS